MLISSLQEQLDRGQSSLAVEQFDLFQADA
jgi:hypothetical protein